MLPHLRHLSIVCLIILFLTGCNLNPAAPLAIEVPTRTPKSGLTQTPMLTVAVTATPVLPTTAPQATPSVQLESIIPKPVSVTPSYGTFRLTPGVMIYFDPTTPEVKAVAQYLAELLNPATGYHIGVMAVQADVPRGSILMSLDNANESLGEEGYELEITPGLVKLTANQPSGLFYAVQTFRQLLPAAIESSNLHSGAWVLAAGKIMDTPRFTYRGVMLDVARHFLNVEDVKRYIDLLALYKINYLHLHLTDDQGWRIEIKSWPNLSAIGGKTEIGGGPGGFYSQSDYSDIVEYAQRRFITIVPEIDMPGHVTAALGSYPILNCDRISPEISTTIHVRYSTLCMSSKTSYQVMEDVLHEVIRMTPGPFIHIGGDEAGATSEKDYITFMLRVQSIVEAEGKRLIGWEEIAQIPLSPGSVVQHWNFGEGNVGKALQHDSRLIMSPVDKAYMNVKYDPTTQLGPDVGLFLNVETAYEWNPQNLVEGVNEDDILGIEAPLWTETLQSMGELEYMTFPRLLGYAEIGWTPQAQRNWEGYRQRLGEQGPRLTELGVNFFRSPEISWK